MQLLRLVRPAGLAHQTVGREVQRHPHQVRHGAGQRQQPDDGDDATGPHGRLTEHEGLADGHPPLDGDGGQGQDGDKHGGFLHRQQTGVRTETNTEAFCTDNKQGSGRRQTRRLSAQTTNRGQDGDKHGGFLHRQQTGVRTETNTEAFCTDNKQGSGRRQTRRLSVQTTNSVNTRQSRHSTDKSY